MVVRKAAMMVMMLVVSTARWKENSLAERLESLLACLMVGSSELIKAEKLVS